MSVFRVSRFLCSMFICYEQSMYISIFMYGYVTVRVLTIRWLDFVPRTLVKVTFYLCADVQCAYSIVPSYRVKTVKITWGHSRSYGRKTVSSPPPSYRYAVKPLDSSNKIKEDYRIAKEKLEERDLNYMILY